MTMQGPEFVCEKTQKPCPFGIFCETREVYQEGVRVWKNRRHPSNEAPNQPSDTIKRLLGQNVCIQATMGSLGCYIESPHSDQAVVAEAEQVLAAMEQMTAIMLSGTDQAVKPNEEKGA